MKKGLTEIVMVMDRSGSMSSVRDETVNGINVFIDEQRKEKGKAVFTLIQFDTQYEVVHDGVDLDDVPKIDLLPRGSTALLDAVGKAINTVGERLGETKEWHLPEKVIVVIVTDGHENASHEFTLAQIRTMIEHQESKYDWTFAFLGADAGAFDDAASYGISSRSTAHYNPKHLRSVYLSTSSAVSRVRSGADTMLNYTADERGSMLGETKKDEDEDEDNTTEVE